MKGLDRIWLMADSRWQERVGNRSVEDATTSSRQMGISRMAYGKWSMADEPEPYALGHAR